MVTLNCSLYHTVSALILWLLAIYSNSEVTSALQTEQGESGSQQLLL